MIESLKRSLPSGTSLQINEYQLRHFLGGGDASVSVAILRSGIGQLTRSGNEDLFGTIDRLKLEAAKNFRAAQQADYRRAIVWLRAIQLMYWLRNYFLDGILPIALGIIALLTIFLHWDLTWIQSYLPSFKTLGHRP